MSELITTPGCVDIHVHLREPSSNTSETIESGTRAALLGGFVLVADMPNNPGMPVWNLERLNTKQRIAEQTAYIPTAFYAGSQPESDNVAELARMAPHSIGLKLYGDPTTGNDKTYEASEFEAIVHEWHRVAPEKPIMFHAGQSNLVDMIPMVAGKYEHTMHVCHVNNTDQVELVGEAKEADMQVTCGVCPHHLLLDSHYASTHGTFGEMMPPLAHQAEAEQLMDLLEDGSIDVIESDFAPHSEEAKYEAEHSGGHCYGMPGIEHVAPLLFYQVEKGNISADRLIDAMHTKPAEILGVRFEATSVVWNKEAGAYRISEEDVKAQCGWTPYLGMLAIGMLERVTIGGLPVFSGGKTITHPAIQRRSEVVEKHGHLIF